MNFIQKVLLTLPLFIDPPKQGLKLLVAIFSDVLLKRVKALYKHTEKIRIAGGVLIIFMGLVLMTNNLYYDFSNH